MASPSATVFRLAVLNPQGHDPDQLFANSAGVPSSAEHAPVNYHAYAACTHGGFFRSTKAAIAFAAPTIVLLRRDLTAGLKAIRQLKKADLPVAISFKEAGSHQVAATLSRPSRIAQFREACTLADFCLASTPDLVTTYRAASPATPVAFIPTPYPLTNPHWDFSIPIADRQGILIGTREFATPSRNHLTALFCATEINRRTNAPITVLNTDGRKGQQLIESVGFPAAQLTIIDGTRAYPDYLRLVASHRLMFQLDHSAVPGQVAGDALLCRLPCVGGDGASERLAFQPINGFGRTSEELVQLTCHLLTNETAYTDASVQAQKAARQKLSFEAVAGKLEAFFCQ